MSHDHRHFDEHATMTESGHGHHGHARAPGHDHAGGHHHGAGGHAPADFGRAFLIGMAVNVAFVLAEAGFGLAGGSMALLADAGHNLSDVLGLTLAWAAASLGTLPPSGRFTYGLGKSSILAALFNALLLVLAMGAITWEAIHRLTAPEPVASMTVIVVAAIGIGVNGFTAWLFARGHEDLNIRGAFVHMAADAAVSLGVVIAGVAMLFTHWTWIDPLVSLLIVLGILWGTWGLLRDSVLMSLAGVPPGIETEAVRTRIEGLPGVASVHDLHVWPMSTTETALTAHLVMPDGCPDDAFIRQAEEEMQHCFGIGHSTFQVERSPEACNLAHAARV
jgi:cobalt-zinc-cadmium efflux system protein